MVDSLVRNYLQTGMSPAAVRRLLGEPETQGGSGSSGNTTQDDGYALTYSPLLQLPALMLKWRSKNPYLYVRYENGKLIKTEVK